MTEYGLTEIGFNRKTFEILYSEMSEFVRSRLGNKFDLSETEPQGAILTISADVLAKVWEDLEIAAGGLNPDNATGGGLVAICKTKGVYRKAASRGLVTEIINVAWPAYTTIEQGALLVSVAGDATNVWRNRDRIYVATATIISGEVQPQNLSVVFESVNVGSAAIAYAGTLTNIVTKLGGFISANNAENAEPGKDQETLEEMRERQRYAKIGNANGTATAIRAAVNEVNGVQYVNVTNNTKDVYVDSVPPHCINVLVWDGTTHNASDADIAQAIYGQLKAGTGTSGSSYYDITDDNGTTRIWFDRCTPVDVYLAVKVYGQLTQEYVAQQLPNIVRTIPGQTLYPGDVVNACYKLGAKHVENSLIGLSLSTRQILSIKPGSREVFALSGNRIEVTVELL